MPCPFNTSVAHKLRADVIFIKALVILYHCMMKSFKIWYDTGISRSGKNAGMRVVVQDQAGFFLGNLTIVSCLMSHTRKYT